MKKTKNIKRSMRRKSWKAVGILFFCLLAFAGCGRGASTGDPNRIVYQAEYKNLDFGQSWVDDILEQDGFLYMLQQVYSEEDGTSTFQFLKTELAAAGTADGMASLEEIPLFAVRENEYLNGLAQSGNGNFLMFSSVYQEEDSLYYLYEVTPDGQKVREQELTAAANQGGIEYIQTITADKQGNIYLSGSNETGTAIFLLLDETGAVKGKLEHNDYVDNFFCTDTGLYMTTWGSSSTGGMVLRKIDFAANKIGAEVPLTGVGYNGSTNICPLASGGFLLNASESGLYECDEETGECVKVLDWMDSDILAQNIQSFGAVGETDYWAFNMNHNASENITGELILLKQTTAGKLPQKTIVTYGGMGVGQDIREAMVNFNKTNPEYRIQIKDYTPEVFEEIDDYENAIIRFNSDIAGAGSPDIIDLSIANYQMLANKGVLADLNTMIAKDDSFQAEDYLENVFRAYEIDGKLYGVMAGFYVNALAGTEEMLKGIDRWNMTEMIEFAEKYPDARLFDTIATGILSTILWNNMDGFINWETGECDFTGEDFRMLLDFAKTFPAEMDDWNSPDRIGTHEGLSEGHFLLSEQYLSEIMSVQVTEALFEAPVKFIGYPCEEGSGVGLSPTASLGISARSREKEGAWEFISYLLSAEQQIDDTTSDGYFGTRWGFPVLKSAFDALCENAMEDRYYTDENGNEVKRPVTTMGYDDLEIEIYAATQAQVDQFRELVAKASLQTNYDMQLNNIINEETESFFNGQKSAAEVAEIIQSRIQIYVNENR